MRWDEKCGWLSFWGGSSSANLFKVKAFINEAPGQWILSRCEADDLPIRTGTVRLCMMRWLTTCPRWSTSCDVVSQPIGFHCAKSSEPETHFYVSSFFFQKPPSARVTDSSCFLSPPGSDHWQSECLFIVFYVWHLFPISVPPNIPFLWRCFQNTVLYLFLVNVSIFRPTSEDAFHILLKGESINN